MTLELAPASLASVLPRTQYYEIDSDVVGARFAVWVTLPARYDDEPDAAYPVIYQTDGNMSAPATAGLSATLRDDPINPVEPFVQVSVGYTAQDPNWLVTTRARDLLPPGEPLPPGVDEAGMQAMVEAGIMTAEDGSLYLKHLRAPRADAFLSFLTEELHPEVVRRFRIDEARTGLHGFSYGGLFATYAALTSSHFRRVGAGSPGIVAGESRIFEHHAAVAAGQHAERLHITLGEPELTVASPYQVLVAAGATELIALTGTRPVPGLAVTSAIIPNESHATGYTASWFSFLRTCYGAQQVPLG